MSTQVSSLQAELASVKAMLGEERRRPPPSAWVSAIMLLCTSGLLVVAGIILGNQGSADAAAANSFQAEANRTFARSEHILLPVYNLVRHKSSSYFFAHVGNLTTFAKNADEALRAAKVIDTYDHEALVEQRYADREQLEGPGLVAFGSALIGAVLGWMVPLYFASYYRRSSGGQREGPTPNLLIRNRGGSWRTLPPTHTP